MDLFDVLIILAAIGYAIGGYRSGAIVGVFSMGGFVGGAVLGARLAEPIGSSLANGRAQVPVAIVLVLVLAVVGQLIGVVIGTRVRQRVLRPRGRPFDAGLGAIIGVASVFVVAWMIAVPLASSPYPDLAREAGQSRIVRQVDDALPDGARHLYSSLREFFDRSGFPPVFGDLPSTSVTPVAEPPRSLSPALRTRIYDQERGSIVKIVSSAPSCDRGIEGSGFVYARHYVLTNAHVVAGASSVDVQQSGGDGQTLRATVVVYDPNRDLAVLHVPELDAAPLTTATGTAARGAVAYVVGYPENGPFTVTPARIRGESEIGGTNIYGQGNVTRSIYSVRSVVREGNSGGPLLDARGQVIGVVFATARDVPDTGFALTNAEARTVRDAGRGRAAAVATGSCTP